MRVLRDASERWRTLDSRSRLRLGYLLIALLSVALAWSALAGKTAQLERKRSAREADLGELMRLRMAYRTAKLSADSLAGRMSMVRADDSPAGIMEEMGIRGKSIRVSPGKREERNGIVEDVAEVRIDGLTANEAFNLLHRLEKGNRPILLKKADLRVRFDDPSRFDLNLTIALMRPVPGRNG